MSTAFFKHIVISIISAFLLVFQVSAQNSDIEKAAELYKQNDFKAAAEMYESILKTQGESAELFYNLGNCYYKLDETAFSVLNYERALRISPHFDDAKNNLELAQAKVVDNIIQTPDFFIKNWVNLLVKIFQPDRWFYISVLFFIISLIAVFLFLFSANRSVRKSSFYSGFIIFSLSIFTFIFSGIRKNQMLNHDEAVITSGVVIVKSSPDRSGTDLFQLHEGSKVKVKGSLGEWTEIRIGNGDIGWVETENIIII